MRIGYDITGLYVAQAGVFTYRYCLIQALLREDRDNDYLLLDYAPLRERHPDLPQIADLATQNSRIVHCAGLRHRRLARWAALQHPALRLLAGLVDRTLLWPWSAAARAVMRQRLTQVLDGVDVFHSSDVLLWRQPGALSVVTILDLTALLHPEFHTASTIEMQLQKYRFAQEEADAVIAVSEVTKSEIVTHLKIPAGRVYVVHVGVDPAFYPIRDHEAVARVLAPMRLRPGEFILHVGTIEPRKNLVRLVEAFHEARGAFPSPRPKLALAGGRGWLYREVFERVAALGLQKEIIFLGRVPGDTLPALYNGALIFAYPSLCEGFGLPPLEAMACGVPVIASHTSSLPEVVGDAGILIDPTDTQALANALVSLAANAELRADLSARGLARAALFSWEEAARKTLEVYALAKEREHAQ